MWFKVDDKLHDHRKTRKALRASKKKRRDAAAMGLWVLAGSWSADNLTDGFVPSDELHRWDDEGVVLAGRLVAAGLWIEDEHEGEPGYRFHEWGARQPTRRQVEEKRESARERMRRVRQHKPVSSDAVRANSDGTSYEVRSTPTRPDPTTVVTTPVKSPSATPATGLTDGLTDNDLTQIQKRLRCDRPHALRVAELVLSKAKTDVVAPGRYVLAAVEERPDDYRQAFRNTRDNQCPTHPGHPLHNCGGCRADALAAD